MISTNPSFLVAFYYLNRSRNTEKQSEIRHQQYSQLQWGDKLTRSGQIESKVWVKFKTEIRDTDKELEYNQTDSKMEQQRYRKFQMLKIK